MRLKWKREGKARLTAKYSMFQFEIYKWADDWELTLGFFHGYDIRDRSYYGGTLCDTAFMDWEGIKSLEEAKVNAIKMWNIFLKKNRLRIL